MILKDEKIVLRAATPADADILLAWWNNGAIMAHAGFPGGLGTTKEKVLENIAWSDDNRKLIILEYGGKPIGEMNYRTAEGGNAEIGIKICETANQEQGIGTRALRLLIAYLFDERKYKKITVDTNLNNKRAQHVYEKAGFKQVGIDYDFWIDQTGTPQSYIRYEMTKTT